jgi:hypothetical protein
VLDRIFRGALGATLIAVLAGCSEQVTGSLACPELCANQAVGLRDTILTGSVVVDSTLLGFPLFGSTPDLALVSRGDTADIRVVARYDTLPNTYTKSGGETDSIRVVDTAHVIFVVDTTFAKPKVAVRIDAFDVDTTADDVNAVVPLFRDDRLLGSRVYQPADIKDTLQLPLNNAAVLAKIRANKGLRIGLRISAAQGVQLRIAGSTMIPIVRFRPTTDTTVRLDTVALRSKTPADDPARQAALSFYPVIVSGALPAPPVTRLAVGGIAGARTYLKFEIPDIVLDSVEVVRATVQLVQLPSRTLGGSADSITLSALAVLASPSFTDLYTLAGFSLASGSPSLTLVPRDSGLKELELASLVRGWKANGSKNVLRAIFLRATQERASPGELNFFSTEGPSALRPRLRLTYVPRRGFGLP